MKNAILIVTSLVVALAGCSAIPSEKSGSVGQSRTSKLVATDNEQTSRQATRATAPSVPPKEEPVNRREETFYLNDALGWKAEYDFYGMFREDMTLDRTSDGGKSWTEIANADEGGSALPGGVKSGFVFTGDKKGWLTTNAPWEGKIGLFTTEDGGYTWQDAQVKVPDSFRDSMLYVFPPLFLSADIGILVTKPVSRKSLLYMTKDGGETWAPIVNEKDGKLNAISWSLSEDGIYKITGEKTWELNTAGSGKWVRE